MYISITLLVNLLFVVLFPGRLLSCRNKYLAKKKSANSWFLVDQLLSLWYKHSKSKRMQIDKQRKNCIHVTTFYSLSLSFSNNTQSSADLVYYSFNIFKLFLNSMYIHTHIRKSSSQMMDGIIMRRKSLFISFPTITPELKIVSGT